MPFNRNFRPGGSQFIATESAVAQERDPPMGSRYLDGGRAGARPSHGEPPSGRRTAMERRPYRMMMQAPDGSAVTTMLSTSTRPRS